MGLGFEKLISIGDPIEYSGDLLDDYLVVVVVTDKRSIKLIYSRNDPSKRLDELLEQSGISNGVKKGILASIGFTTTSVKSAPFTQAAELPGIKLQVKHPVTGKSSTLYNTIIDLNDRHQWTRESIADWIENVCDIKDIAFNIPEGQQNETGTLSSLTKVVEIKRVLTG